MADTPGSPLELGEVYRAHAGQVGRWVVRLGGPDVDADDLVQDVFLTVRPRLEGFRPTTPSSLTTWLYRITQNIVLRHRRRERWRRFFFRDEGQLEELQGPGRTPAEAAESEQATRLAYRILDGMNETQRTAFILYELEELSGPECAELLGITENALGVRVHRARQEFSLRLQKLERAAARRREQVSGAAAPLAPAERGS
jgi:RNA polymerase sigma-70 factor (ECF subfamily)